MKLFAAGPIVLGTGALAFAACTVALFAATIGTYPPPTCDEAIYASSAVALLEQGNFGVTLFPGEGPYRGYLEKLVVKLKVSNAITFIGRIQHADLPRYICAGDIFAMPSRSRLAGLEVEGLGIVYLEASSCELPVVAGISGGAPDAVVEGVTGLTVDGTNPDDVARAIISLFDDPQAARAMGAAGRKWIYSNWRWQIWAGAFRDLLIKD